MAHIKQGVELKFESNWSKFDFERGVPLRPSCAWTFSSATLPDKCSHMANTNGGHNASDGHLVHQSLLQARVWGWGCHWRSSESQTSTSSSRSCWSGSSPGGWNIERKNLKSKLPLRWVWSRWPVECQTKIRGCLGRGSNRPLPSGTSPRRGESAARRELKIRFVQIWITKCHQSTFLSHQCEGSPICCHCTGHSKSFIRGVNTFALIWIYLKKCTLHHFHPLVCHTKWFISVFNTRGNKGFHLLWISLHHFHLLVCHTGRPGRQRRRHQLRTPAQQSNCSCVQRMRNNWLICHIYVSFAFYQDAIQSKSFTYFLQTRTFLW